MAGFQILCLDGGGIRGVFSAGVLANIEERTGRPITDHFDLIVGTSTGGIIALGLGYGLSARQILDFYIENGKDIFPSFLPNWARQIPLSRFLEPRNYRAIFHRKFSNKPLSAALQKVFGEKTLLGHSSKRLVITSYDLQRNSVKLFKTAHHERFELDYKLPMSQIGLATSAAPTYFRAAKANERFLLDGGLWANDPIMVGAIEAVGVLKQCPSDISVLSLGTLDEIRPLKNINIWGGKALWAKPAIDSMMAGQSTGAQGQAKLLLGGENILRISPSVPAGVFSLDDTSRIGEMLGLAAGEAEHRSPEIKDRFFDHIAAPFQPHYEVTSNG